jgi:hypothetical protein
MSDNKRKNMSEIFDPVKDFFIIRKGKEKLLFYGIPVLVGIISIVLFIFVHGNNDFNLPNFTNEFVNQLITMLTLFVSFTMAYLSIIVSSSSRNIDDLKSTKSEKYYLKRKKDCTLYQILVSEITYNLLIEILFLLITMVEKFILCISNSMVCKVMLAIDITLFVHVLFIMMIIVKDIYFSFWKSE